VLVQTGSHEWLVLLTATPMAPRAGASFQPCAREDPNLD
jgi:hypothetical protein